MSKLSNSDLEGMFIEFHQEFEDDKVKFGQFIEYSRIEMIKDHDPVCFRQAYLDWLDMELEAETIIEHNDEYYLAADFIDTDDGSEDTDGSEDEDGMTYEKEPELNPDR